MHIMQAPIIAHHCDTRHLNAKSKKTLISLKISIRDTNCKHLVTAR